MTEFPIRLFEGQANFIKTLRFHPCAEPFPILIETFFPCALQLAIDLYMLDSMDMLRERFRSYPQKGISPSPKRGRRHNFKKRGPTGPLSRKQVKAVPFVAKPLIASFTKWLLLVTDPLEKVGFAMLFYNSVDQFFMNWSSLLVRRGYCELPALTGPLSLSGNPGSQIWSNGGLPVSTPNEIQNRAGWAHSNTSCALPPGTYTVIFTAMIKSLPGSYNSNLFLSIKEGFFPIAASRHDGEKVACGPDEYVAVSVTATVGSPTFILNEVWWEATSDAPLATTLIKDMHVIIFQNYEEISY